MPDLVELIRASRLLIGNETSAVHIAVAVDTPSVCILGGGHYGRFMPYELADGDAPRPAVAMHKMPCFGCDWRCSQPHQPGKAMPCIAAVSVADVVNAIKRALADRSALMLA